MMETLQVNLKKEIDHSYEIIIGKGLFLQIAQYLKKEYGPSSIVIISDSQVSRLYGTQLNEALAKVSLNSYLIEFEAGEERKNRATKAYLEDQMLQRGLGRDTVILALGGGVVGDLAGFLAATYNRGIPYIQIPTTVIAQVDSSVGGKTGIDVPQGKNLIGAFYQPKKVYIDIDLLKTLPERELKAGLAEVVKYGVILDGRFFSFLEEHCRAILHLEDKPWAYLLKRCCQLKAQIVEADEREENLRKILNYGHTLGHAIEAWSNYSLRHGEAIALGMIAEGWLACALGYMESTALDRIGRLISNFGLPSRLGTQASIDDIIRFTYWDKKAREGEVQYVLPAKIGTMVMIEGAYGLTIKNNGLIREALKYLQRE
jgi:3-dehydroquinate synthase